MFENIGNLNDWVTDVFNKNEDLKKLYDLVIVKKRECDDLNRIIASLITAERKEIFIEKLKQCKKEYIETNKKFLSKLKKMDEFYKTAIDNTVKNMKEAESIIKKHKSGENYLDYIDIHRDNSDVNIILVGHYAQFKKKYKNSLELIEENNKEPESSK